MGQQQLLMIILSIIIIGVAIAVALNLFRANAIDRKRELLINESHNLGSIAISYFKKPAMMGGGGKNFTGWTIPSSMASTVNGSYIAQVFKDSVVIIGTGTEVITENDSIKIQTVVTGNRIYSTTIN